MPTEREQQIAYLEDFLRQLGRMARTLGLDPVVPYLLGLAELEVANTLKAKNSGP